MGAAQGRGQQKVGEHWGVSLAVDPGFAAPLIGIIGHQLQLQKVVTMQNLK